MLLRHDLKYEPADIEKHSQNHDETRHKESGKALHEPGIEIIYEYRDKQYHCNYSQNYGY